MGKKKTSFLIKDIDVELWKKIKMEAIKHNMTLREFVIVSLNTMLGRDWKEDK